MDQRRGFEDLAEDFRRAEALELPISDDEAEPGPSSPGMEAAAVVAENPGQEEEEEMETEASEGGIVEDLNAASTDGSTCSICFDEFTTSGEHRISCLRCGHVFGKDCIVRWLRQHARCPKCNSKAKARDVRDLYVKSLAAVDNTEAVALKEKLKAVEETCMRYQMECARVNITANAQAAKIRMLEDQVSQYKAQARKADSGALPAADNVGLGPQHLPSPLKTAPGRKTLNLQLVKSFDIKDSQCRVGVYNEWRNMLLVSQETKNSLYPNGCGSVQKYNMMDLRPSSSLPIHTKQIRDMEFSILQTDILLSVGLDNKAILFNAHNNVTVQSFQNDCGLWACTWDSVKQNQFYVGTSMGKILAYDIRNPSERMFEISFPTGGSSPICRLRFIPPSYQNSSFKGTGLLVQRLNSIWLCEDPSADKTRFTGLPFGGRLVNVDFETVSRHLLVSERPPLMREDKVGTHRVCELVQTYCEAFQKNVVSVNVVHTYEGGNEQKLCRSAIISPEEGYIYVLANGRSGEVKVWDVSLPTGGHRSVAPGFPTMMDCIHMSVNGNQFIGMIGEKKMSIFKSVLA